MNTLRYDTFISYRQSDISIVNKIATGLRNNGVRIWFDKWGLVPGDAWEITIRNAIEQSNSILLFIGNKGPDNWIQSCINEIVLPHHNIGQKKIIPILLPDASVEDIPQSLYHIKYIDLRNGVENDTELNKIITTIYDSKDKKRDSTEYVPEPLPDTSNFVGREEELKDVRAAIMKNNISIIEGVAGIGKTYVAAKVARELEKSKNVFWYTFAMEGTDSFDSLADKLGKFFAHHGDTRLLDCVRGTPDVQEKINCIINCTENGGFLLFFDNYQWVKDASVHALFKAMTSKDSKARGIIITRRKLDDFTPQEKLRISELLIEEFSKEDMHKAVKKLGLELATSELDKLYKVTAGHPDLLVLFYNLARDRTPAKVLQEAELQDDIESYWQNEVFASLSEEEQKLFCTASIFEKEVPESAYKFVMAEKYSPKTLKCLKGRLILKMKLEDKTYYLHDLLKDFAYSQLKNKKKLHQKAADYYRSLQKNPENILAAYHHFKEAADVDSAGYLLNTEKQIFIYQGYWREFTEKMNEIVVYLESKRSKDARQNLAVTYGNLAYVLDNLGDKDGSLGNYEKALKIVMALGDKADIATINNNIGGIYHDRGELDNALEYFEKALKIGEELGDKAGIATRSNNIGGIYKGRGKLDNALECFEKALKILEELGNKTGIAMLSNNIGGIYHDRGELDNALAYYEKALKISEELGDKASIATLSNNIGMIYHDRGELDNALEYFEKALKIGEELGDKAGIAIDYNNIGGIYHDRGMFDNALAYYKRALKIGEELGDKIGIAMLNNNIGMIYHDRGELDNALEYYEKALKIGGELGDKAGIAVRSNNIGMIYKDRGELDNALEYFEKALKIQEELSDKAGIAIDYNNIGGIYHDRGVLEKALAYYERALKIGEELGDKAGIATRNNNIGMIYEAQGKFHEAAEMFERSLEMSLHIRNPKDIIDAYTNLIRVYSEMKNEEKADYFRTNQIKYKRNAGITEEVLTEVNASAFGLAKSAKDDVKEKTEASLSDDDNIEVVKTLAKKIREEIPGDEYMATEIITETELLHYKLPKKSQVGEKERKILRERLGHLENLENKYMETIHILEDDLANFGPGEAPVSKRKQLKEARKKFNEIHSMKEQVGELLET